MCILLYPRVYSVCELILPNELLDFVHRAYAQYRKRVIVGGAIGTHADGFDRAAALHDAGVDVLLMVSDSVLASPTCKTASPLYYVLVSYRICLTLKLFRG